MFSISTRTLQNALAPIGVPGAITHQEPDAPFRIELSLGDWHVADPGNRLDITVASGFLHDIDKGSYPLDGIRLSLSWKGANVEPVEVLNPGALSELQQAGLMDAAATALTATRAFVSVVAIQTQPAALGLLVLSDEHRATLILENRGQPGDRKSAIIETDAGTLSVAESACIQQSQLLALSGVWTSH